MASDIAHALASAASRLTGSTDSPRAEAEELLSRLLGLSRGELLLRREQALAPEQWERLESWLRRRAHHLIQ